MNRKCNMVWHNLTIPWTKRKRCCWYLISFLVSSFIFCDSYALSYLTLIIQHARFSQLFGLATQLNIIIHLLMHAYKYIEFVCVLDKIQLFIYMRITHIMYDVVKNYWYNILMWVNESLFIFHEKPSTIMWITLKV